MQPHLFFKTRFNHRSSFRVRPHLPLCPRCWTTLYRSSGSPCPMAARFLGRKQRKFNFPVFLSSIRCNFLSVTRISLCFLLQILSVVTFFGRGHSRPTRLFGQSGLSSRMAWLGDKYRIEGFWPSKWKFVWESARAPTYDGSD